MENNNNNNIKWQWWILQALQGLLWALTNANNQAQNERNQYDKRELEANARIDKAEVSERFGSTNERIRMNQRNLVTNQRNLGIAVLGGLAGGFILFRGGQKSIQKIKTEQATAIDQVNKSITDQKTTNEVKLNEVNESIENLATNLQNQIKQTQQTTQETA